jgi:transcription elongation factor Elf1
VKREARSAKRLILTTPIIDQAYREKPTCPRCGSNHIETTGSLEMRDDTAAIQVECRDCHTRWEEIFELDRIVAATGERLPPEASERRKANPAACPFCGAETTFYESGGLEWPFVYQLTHCDNCPWNWDDVYAFTHIENVQR